MRNATTAFILQMLETFLEQMDIFACLASRLAIVEPGQVRLRPA